MHKIEQAMIRAVSSERTRMPSGNTQVRKEGDFLSVYLHGNCIARQMDDGTWMFNLCGWNTPTTRSRINALAREFGHSGVWNKQHCPMTGNAWSPTPVPLNGWF